MSGPRIVYQFLSADQAYEDPVLFKRLRFLTNGGWGRHPVGSAMHDDLMCRTRGTIILAQNWVTKEVVGWAWISTNRHPRNRTRSVRRSRRPGRPYKDRLQVAVYVQREYRRLGLGAGLLSEAVQHAATKGRDLLVAPWNTAGERLYDRADLVYEVWGWDHYPGR